MNGHVVKPGLKTTELAVTVLLGIGNLAAALAGSLSPRWASVATGLSVGAYAISRGLAKRPPQVVVQPVAPGPGGSPTPSGPPPPT